MPADESSRDGNVEATFEAEEAGEGAAGVMAERKIICEIQVGSHLYGTNRPDSDKDFQGVFLPSSQDLLGLQEAPKEWSRNIKVSDGPRNTKDDVDRKFFNLKRFMHLAAEGQPGQLEMLFAPSNMIVSHTPEWLYLQSVARPMFLSRQSIAPLIGFSLSQAHKATLKGENLRLIREVLEWSKILMPEALNGSVLSNAVDKRDSLKLSFGGPVLKVVTNDQGFRTIEIGGRNYDVNLKTQRFLNNLRELESKYGARSRAAADSAFDFKSLMHAYRLLGEAKELLLTGKITLPRPAEEVAFLRRFIKSDQNPNPGLGEGHDYFADIQNRITELREVIEPQSPLPEEPDHKRINELCIKMLSKHLFLS